MKRKLTKYIDDTYFSYGDTKYNIQLAQYKDYVLIGYPLIMQGF